VPGATISIGIDVAEPHKGIDLVALDGGRSVLASHGRLTVEEAARITMSMRRSVRSPA
jgi:hypothetical protein